MTESFAQINSVVYFEKTTHITFHIPVLLSKVIIYHIKTNINLIFFHCESGELRILSTVFKNQSSQMLSFSFKIRR